MNVCAKKRCTTHRSALCCRCRPPSLLGALTICRLLIGAWLHFSRSTRLAFLCTFGIVVWEKPGKTHSRSPKRKRTKREAAARKSENRKPNQHAPDLMSKDEGALRSTNELQKLKSTTRLRCLESKTKGETALRKTRTMPALRNTTKRNAKSANAPRTTEVASRMAKYQNRKSKAEQGANPCWG